VSSATTTPPSTPRRRRNVALVVVDIIASLAILSFTLVFGLVMLQFVGQMSDAARTCGADCNSGLLTAAAWGLLAVTVIVFCLGLGMAIVRAVQRRYTVLWPLGAFVVMYAAFFVASWLTGQAVPAS